MSTSALAFSAAMLIGAALTLPEAARAQDITVPLGDTLAVPPDIDTTGLLSVLGTLDIGQNGDVVVQALTVDGGQVDIGTLSGGGSLQVGSDLLDGTTTLSNGATVTAGLAGSIRPTSIGLFGTTTVGAGAQLNGLDLAILSFSGTFTVEDGGSVVWISTFGGQGTNDTLIVEGTLASFLPVALRGGNDTVVIRDTATLTASFDGGDATDTLTLNGTGTGSFDLGSVSNFEVLVKDESGSWTLSGERAFQRVQVNGGTLTVGQDATLNLGGIGNQSAVAGGTLTVADGGTINLDGMLEIGSGATLQVDTGGAFNGGSDQDTLFVYGSLVANGSVNLGGGSDLLALGTGYSVTGSSPVDGGEGTDVIGFLGDGSFDLDRMGTDFVGFEVLYNLSPANWTLSGAASVETLLVFGAPSGGHLTLGSGATLNVTGVAPTAFVSGAEELVGTPSTVISRSTYLVLGSHTDTNDTAILVGTLIVGDGGVYTSNGVTRLLGGTLEIQAGGTYNALGGLTGVDEGPESLIVAGTLNLSGNVAFGTGNDLLSIDTDATITAGASFDGGGDTDTLRLTGTGSRTEDMSRFQNFEIVEKRDDGFWSLLSSDPASPATVSSINVEAGELVLLGLWKVTGNTTTVAVGATLTIGDGGTQSAIDEAEDLEVFGTLRVRNDGSVAVGGPTTVAPGGVFTVENGGSIQLGDLVVQGTASDAGDHVFGALSLLGGGNGSAGAVTVTGGAIVVGGDFLNGDLSSFGPATFVAAGPVTVSGSVDVPGVIVVLPNASFTAHATTTASGGEVLVAGSYLARGAVLVERGGRIGMLELLDHAGEPLGPLPVFTAQQSTTVDGIGSTISVPVGNYIGLGPVSATNGAGITVSKTGIFDAPAGTTITNGAFLALSEGGSYVAGQPVVLTEGGSLFFGHGDTPGGPAGTVFGTVNNVSGVVGLPVDLLIAGGDERDIPGIFPGSLRIVGAYNQGAGGNFVAPIVGGFAGQQVLVVEGQVQLAGNVTVVVLRGPFPVGDQFRIIASDRPIDGMFDTATIRGDIGRLTAVVLKTNDAGLFKPSDGNNVDVLFVDPALPRLGLSGNQAAVADALVGDLPVGGIVIAREDVLAGVLGMLYDPNILEQVGPESYDSFTAFSFEVARQFGGLIDARLRGLRCAAGGGALCGSSGTGLFASDRRDPVLIADASAGQGVVPSAGQRAVAAPDSRRSGSNAGGANGGVGPHPSGWSVWATGLGAGLWKDRTSDNLGYSGWTTGGAAGVDLTLGRQFVLGVLAGATRSNIDFDGVTGKGDMDSVTTGVYAAWYGRRLFANAAFTYTKNWVEADRDITFLPAPLTANGKTEGDQYAAHATLGMAFRLRRLSVEASGGVDWISLRQNGFTETGAGVLNLTVDGRTDDSLRLRAGVRLARAFLVRPGFVIAPSVRVGYAREMQDTTRPITASLVGLGGSFTVTGDDGGRDFLTFGGGLQAVWSQGLTLFVAQSGEWAQDRLALSFTGGLRVSW